MSANQIKSLYIPYIPSYNTAEDVRGVFQHLQIGCVDRVDFFENPKASDRILSAFVHLSDWYLNPLTDDIYKTIGQKDGKWNIDIFDMETGRYSGFWTLKKMTTPKVPDSIYNIHQLAQRMETMQTEIDELRSIVEERNNQTSIKIEEDDTRGPRLELSDLLSEDEEWSARYQEDRALNMERSNIGSASNYL